jgi:hypothetical protein
VGAWAGVGTEQSSSARRRPGFESRTGNSPFLVGVGGQHFCLSRASLPTQTPHHTKSKLRQVLGSNPNSSSASPSAERGRVAQGQSGRLATFVVVRLGARLAATPTTLN